MKFLFTQKPNAVAITILLLKLLKVKVSTSTISICLQDHPAYPYLLAINESLAQWHVANEVYRIPKENYDPADLFFPFIAHFNENGGKYILVHEIKNATFIYSDEKTKKATIAADEFLKRWSGVALHATATAKSAEPNYKANKLKEDFNAIKIPLLFGVILATLLLSFNYQTINLSYGLLLVLKLAGIGVSIILLIHSIDANNPLIQNLCSLGNKNNCNAILKSDAVKLTSWLSWSEIGFFYFTGSLLSLLLNPLSLRS